MPLPSGTSELLTQFKSAHAKRVTEFETITPYQSARTKLRRFKRDFGRKM